MLSAKTEFLLSLEKKTSSPKAFIVIINDKNIVFRDENIFSSGVHHRLKRRNRYCFHLL